jgi:hypothetical protein
MAGTPDPDFEVGEWGEQPNEYRVLKAEAKQYGQEGGGSRIYIERPNFFLSYVATAFQTPEAAYADARHFFALPDFAPGDISTGPPASSTAVGNFLRSDLSSQSAGTAAIFSSKAAMVTKFDVPAERHWKLQHQSSTSSLVT